MWRSEFDGGQSELKSNGDAATETSDSRLYLTTGNRCRTIWDLKLKFPMDTWPIYGNTQGLGETPKYQTLTNVNQE